MRKETSPGKMKGGVFQPSPCPKSSPTTSVMQQNVIRWVCVSHVHLYQLKWIGWTVPDIQEWSGTLSTIVWIGWAIPDIQEWSGTLPTRVWIGWTIPDIQEWSGTLLTIESLDWVTIPDNLGYLTMVIPDTWDVMVDSYPTCCCSVLWCAQLAPAWMEKRVLWYQVKIGKKRAFCQRFNWMLHSLSWLMWRRCKIYSHAHTKVFQKT